MVLLSVWALLPMGIYMNPGLFGLLPEHVDWYEFLRAVGTAWLYLGVGALLFRAGQLLFSQGLEAALAWMSKILTDPFHDIYLYHKAPWQLLQGKRYASAEELAAEANTPAHVPTKLSKRQKQLILMLDQGLSNRDIAEKLNISEHTVKVHFWRLFRRLGVNSRTQALHFARTNGWLGI